MKNNKIHVLKKIYLEEPSLLTGICRLVELKIITVSEAKQMLFNIKDYE